MFEDYPPHSIGWHTFFQKLAAGNPPSLQEITFHPHYAPSAGDHEENGIQYLEQTRDYLEQQKNQGKGPRLSPYSGFIRGTADLLALYYRNLEELTKGSDQRAWDELQAIV